MFSSFGKLLSADPIKEDDNHDDSAKQDTEQQHDVQENRSSDSSPFFNCELVCVCVCV